MKRALGKHKTVEISNICGFYYINFVNLKFKNSLFVDRSLYMKVMCIKNSGDTFSKVLLKQGYNRDTIISLETNKEYVVYGISSLDGELDYLILAESENLPSWYPAELFEVSNPLQPLEWYFADHKKSKATTIEYMWGYKELALNDRHALGLIERENEDIEIFLKRKAEIDEFEEL